jgi:hypothetical protein
MIKQRVEFQTDICSYGEGEVVAYDSSSVTVREEDGTTWCGHEDQTTPVDDDE